MIFRQLHRSKRRWDFVLLAMGVSVTMVGTSVAVGFIIRPINDQRRQLHQELKEFQQVLDRGEVVVAEFNGLRDQLRETRDRMRNALERIPDAPHEADFLAQISAMAGRVGLEVRDYRPGMVRDRREYQEMEVQLSCQGSYASLCGFLADVGTAPRLCRIVAMDVTPRGKADMFDVNMSLAIYFASKSSANALE